METGLTVDMHAAIREVINKSIEEARMVSGSEGLYQCIIYSHAMEHPDIDHVEREYKIKLSDGKSGNVDFVLDVGDEKYAIELKAGANSHRNSLDKAKEIDKKYGAKRTGGILKDLDKLSSFMQLDENGAHKSIQVCLEVAYMPRGFDEDDILSYSKLANDKSISFVYGTEGYSGKATWIVEGEKHIMPFDGADTNLDRGLKNFDIGEYDWKSYFEEINHTEPKHEAFAQGNFYHQLRAMGLSEKQCASEVYFHFAKIPNKKPASYWKPDIAVFDESFYGRFNLGNSNQKRNNDFEKLNSLLAIIEIKGSEDFRRRNTEEKIGLIDADLDKLYQKLRPAINSKSRSEGIVREVDVKLVMAVADSSSELEDYIRKAQKKYEHKVEIYWSGDYC